MNNTVKFGTFNVGGGWEDYAQMLKGNGAEGLKLLEKFENLERQYDHEEALKSITRSIEEVVAKKLCKELDVISLQEVKDVHRPFIATLRAEGYSIYSYEGSKGIDTAIAIRDNVFASIKNHSYSSQSHPDSHCPYGQDVALVVAKVKNSPATIAFASLHSWGFKLYPKGHVEEDVLDADNKQYAVRYANEAVDKIHGLGATLSMIGGDMNNNRENFSRPFKVIESSHFSTLEPDEDSNINNSDSDYKFRKVDFIFHSTEPFWKKFLHRQPAARFAVEDARVLKGFDFTFEGNCSDHKPVGTVITYQ